MRFIPLLIASFAAAAAQEPCQVASPTATFSIPYFAQPQELSTDPGSPVWARAASAFIEHDCTHKTAYPKLKSQVRGFWTDTDLYLLFACPYDKLNLWQPADNTKDRDKLFLQTYSSEPSGESIIDCRSIVELNVTTIK